MAWMFAALAMLVSALVAWRRASSRRRCGDRETNPRPDTVPSKGGFPQSRANEPEPPPPPVKSCPVCLSEYPPRNRFCVRDGAELREGRSSAPFSHGMICPTCRRGYPSDAGFCPEDADELVPYGLYGAASTTRPSLRLDSHKICPECGIRHAAVHLFCGQDGSELVVVN